MDPLLRLRKVLSIPGKGNGFFSSPEAFKPGVEPTQTSLQWVGWALSLGSIGQGVKLSIPPSDVTFKQWATLPFQNMHS